MHLSDIAAEDETEGLLNKIDDLEKQLKILQTQAQTQQTQLQTYTRNSYSPNWTLILPNNINGRIDFADSHLQIISGISTNLLDWNSYASINDVASNVILDVVNRRLTIGGSSCGGINVY